jgi:hypothetical protein
MKTSDFQNKWNEFRGQNGYLQRLDPNHPLDFFVGVSEKGYDELALLTTSEPAKLTSSKALEVEKAIRKDGKWATQIYSVEKENQEIFARLCLDLVECSQNSKNEAEGLSNVTKRYLAWQRLFARLKETLPGSVLKGIIGEIDFARLMISRGYSRDEVIEGWVGPDGADRDFVMKNAWYENKAIATGKKYIEISSLNQLETEENGFITVVNVDDASSNDSRAIDVKKYIEQFKKELESAPMALNLFEQKLVSLGYIEKKAYENIFYIIGERVFFKVDDLFPRLITKNVAPEIVSVKYELSLAGIQPWRIGDEIWS